MRVVLEKSKKDSVRPGLAGCRITGGISSGNAGSLGFFSVSTVLLFPTYILLVEALQMNAKLDALTWPFCTTRFARPG